MTPARLHIDNLRYHHNGPYSFTVAGGECVCLSGPSGCGKSLLLRALADLDPHQGEITLDGQAQQQIPPPLWRRQVALLPADSRWWADSVGEHFATPVQAEWLAMLGFEATVWDWQIARLSSGERQRLGLLRMLALQPKVLLLDEPTANLDAVNIGKVEALLQHYRRTQNAALLWISHDAGQIARIADRHGRFENGALHWG